MRVLLTVSLIIGCPLAALTSPAPSMYVDRVAHSVGDILTVEIVESSAATAVSRTNTKSEYGAELDVQGSGQLDFMPFIGAAGTKSEHKGDGRTSRQGTLRGTVSVKVVEVFSNGNMRIEGQKVVTINGEKQLTILTGVVRPEDVTPRNTVRSDLIADADIVFKGKGILANSSRPGFFARIFDWLF